MDLGRSSIYLCNIKTERNMARWKSEAAQCSASAYGRCRTCRSKQFALRRRAALRRAPLGGVAPLPGVTQQRTVISCPRLRWRGQHTTSAFRSRRLAHGAAWDHMPVRYSRISKSNGHGEREQYDRKSLQHSVFLPRYPLTDALVRLTHQRHRISSRHFTGLDSPDPQSLS